MIRDFLPIAAAILALLAPIVYIRAILKGQAKPHRTTRFVLFTISALTVASLLAGKDHTSIWFAFATCIQGAAVFGLSIKYGLGGGSKSDIICLLIALFGVVLWQVTDQPILGLCASITADFVGGIPMFLKTWRRPETEVWTYYAFDVVGSILILAATTVWSFEKLVYPLYILFVNSLVVALVVLPRKKSVLKST
jgi:hypothetical protein